MDYEKKYKEALERARNLRKDAIDMGENLRAKQCEIIFPELAESDNERIRMWLIGYFRQYKEDGIEKYANGLKVDSIIAWLEKQSEKPTSDTRYEVKVGDSLSVVNGKPFDYEHVTITQKDFALKDEPTFKVGDWIVWQNKCYKVNYNGCGYKLVDQNGLSTSLEYGTIDENAHLWSIADAKDGDVLSDGTTIFIFKDLLSDGSVMSYCDYDTDSDESVAFCPSVSLMCSKIIPATNEQRNVLFAKMRDAGYEWDDENKKLREISQKPVDKIESQFHEGDWIVNNDTKDVFLIKSINNGYCTLEDINGNIISPCLPPCESESHIWTIQDAKDGDVLYLQKDGKEHIIIYKGVNKGRFRTFVSAYCAYNSIVDAFCFADVSRYADIAYGDIMPATKEQRDILFAKMKEAGYEWDAEKKEVRNMSKGCINCIEGNLRETNLTEIQKKVLALSKPRSKKAIEKAEKRKEKRKKRKET